MAQKTNSTTLVKKQAKTKLVQSPLDKIKKEFAKLLTDIEKLKRESETRDAKLTEIRRRIQSEINPLMAQVLEMRLEMNDLLERQIADKSFSRREKRTLTDLLFYNCDILERVFGQNMMEVRLKYMTKRERKEFDEIEEVGQILEDLFEEADKQQHAQPDDEDSPKKKRGRKKKMPEPDAVEPHVKKKLDLQRYIRSLYLQLAKRIHPDLEQDEEKKHQRTTLMQHVTTAYQHLDLYELLKAQKELLDMEESEHLEKSLEAENQEMEQLRQYIKILKNQQREIQSDHFTQNFFSPDAALLRKFSGSFQTLEKAFEREKKVFRKEMDKIKEVRSMLGNQNDAREYLEMIKDLPTLEGYF
jgi:hypothetical protein